MQDFAQSDKFLLVASKFVSPFVLRAVARFLVIAAQLLDALGRGSAIQRKLRAGSLHRACTLGNDLCVVVPCATVGVLDLKGRYATLSVQNFSRHIPGTSVYAPTSAINQTLKSLKAKGRVKYNPTTKEWSLASNIY